MDSRPSLRIEYQELRRELVDLCGEEWALKLINAALLKLVNEALEEQQENNIARKIDDLDARFVNSNMTQLQYDAEMEKIRQLG